MLFVGLWVFLVLHPDEAFFFGDGKGGFDFLIGDFTAPDAVAVAIEDFGAVIDDDKWHVEGFDDFSDGFKAGATSDWDESATCGHKVFD